MSQGLNKTMLIGQIGRVPEVRYTPAGKAVTTFMVGVERNWVTPEGHPQTAQDWFNVVAWGELAEQCQKTLKANAMAYVEGRLQVRSWEDAEGRAHHQTEIVAAQVLSLADSAGSQPEPGAD